jgi:hypothetical protein
MSRAPAIRSYDPAIFARLLFGADADGPAQYDRMTVGRLMFEEAVGLLPQRLTASELAMKIVTDGNDIREMETAHAAIGDLQRSQLIRYRQQGLVEPTLVAVCTHALLTARRPYEVARQARRQGASASRGLPARDGATE